MKERKIVFWPALTPALSPGRGRILRRVLSNRELSVIRTFSSADYQPAATDKLTVELSKSPDSCSLSPGERVRVRASVPLTFLLRSNIRRSHRPRVFRQRMWRPLLKRMEDHITNKLLLSPQLPIPEAKLLDAHRSKKPRPHGIVSLLPGKTMLPAIKFNREACFHAIEVEEVNSDRMVAAELVGAETTIAQPAPHLFFSPSLFLPQRASAFRIGHDGRLGRCARFEKDGFDARPHPGPLRHERENHAPAQCIISRSLSSRVRSSELPETGDKHCDVRKTRDARKLSPLPGGEGQGEGERHTNIFSGFRKLVETPALTPALSPRRGRNVRSRSSCRTVPGDSAASLQFSKVKTGGAP